MKKIHFIFMLPLLFYSFEMNAQTLDQSASYRNIELKLPSTWKYETQELFENYAYQITCWENGGYNSFVIQWLEMQMDLEGTIGTTKQSLKEIATITNAAFDTVVVGDFQGNKAMFLDFSGNYRKAAFTGKIIAFNYIDRTFVIYYQGNKDFYNNQLDEKILSALKISELKEEPFEMEIQKDTLSQDSQ